MAKMLMVAPVRADGTLVPPEPGSTWAIMAFDMPDDTVMTRVAEIAFPQDEPEPLPEPEPEPAPEPEPTPEPTPKPAPEPFPRLVRLGPETRIETEISATAKRGDIILRFDYPGSTRRAVAIESGEGAADNGFVSVPRDDQMALRLDQAPQAGKGAYSFRIEKRDGALRPGDHIIVAKVVEP